MDRGLKKLLHSLPFRIGLFIFTVGMLLWLLYRGVPGLYDLATGGRSIYSKAVKFVALPVLILLVGYSIAQLKKVSVELWYLIKKNLSEEEKTRLPSDFSMTDKDEEMD